MVEYITALDGFLALEGKLEKQFKDSSFFKKFYDPLTDEDLVQFEDFYDVLQKWAVNPDQLNLSYDDFAASDVPLKLPGAK